MRVLLGVDIHEANAEAIVDAAVRWAPVGAVIDLMFVDEFEYATHLLGDPTIKRIVVERWGKVKARNAERLDALLARLPDDRRGQALIVNGRAITALPERSADYGLVMVGTQARTGAMRALIGSVAERVVRLSTVPVLVLRY